ncbi:MAG: hypothetical protein GX877_01735 [Bacteroidales bacterium]|nr:hypothetical protein [Bacteroidales bacterium]
MCESIRICRQARAKGIVIGALTREGHLDVPAIKQMIYTATASSDSAIENGDSATASSDSITADGNSEAAKSDPEITEGASESAAGANARLLPPLTLVFHRAFDVCANPQELLEQIIELGFHTVLTSGQGVTAEEGIPLLAQLVKQAQGKIQIMAGRGVTLQNVARIIRETKVPAVHMSERPGLDEIASAIANIRS